MVNQHEANPQALQRVGPAIAQQDAQTAGEGQAPGRQDRCHTFEPGLGDHCPAGACLQTPRGDFVHDQLATGRKLRVLTIVDTHSRYAPATDPRFSYRGEDVVQTLERVCREVGYPKMIRVDNGSEFISRDLDLWAYVNDVTLDFSRPGKPTDNAYIESFNGKFRTECLNQHWFLTLDDARQKMEEWRRDYNEVRPHSAIGNKPPIALMNTSGASGPP